MGDLYLTRIQPNPPGRDASGGGGVALQLNNEWVEFEVIAENRDLTGDVLTHNTYASSGCTLTGTDALVRFASVPLVRGHRVRIHSGHGRDYWEGSLLHVFAERSWYAWNNVCGDRAVLSYDGRVLDWAEYDRFPREGILTRVSGTNRFN